MEPDDSDEEDDYKLDRPSAFSKLVGILKKSSKRQDAWKKRKLEEEGLEDMEDEETVEDEEGKNFVRPEYSLESDMGEPITHVIDLSFGTRATRSRRTD
jgi:U3 small nucleolar RNA-associated protein 25